VVVLANPVWMDWLEAQGAIPDGARSFPFGNRLAVISPPGTEPLGALSAAAVLERLGPSGRFAMGQRDAVPAGLYARHFLTDAGIWTQLEPRLAETDNVRAALALVARAEAPLGIVYETDLRAAGETVTRAWDITPADQPDIRYALAALTDDGMAFARYLGTARARNIVVAHGFILPGHGND
jgi:molybdate transport system substrate-binding protein